MVAPEDSDALWTALRGLAPGQRRVVVLRHYWGLSVDETAADLGISPGTVKSQISDALAPTRRAVGGLDPGRALMNDIDQRAPPAGRQSIPTSLDVLRCGEADSARQVDRGVGDVRTGRRARGRCVRRRPQLRAAGKRAELRTDAGGLDEPGAVRAARARGASAPVPSS